MTAAWEIVRKELDRELITNPVFRWFRVGKKWAYAEKTNSEGMSTKDNIAKSSRLCLKILHRGKRGLVDVHTWV